MSTIFLIDFLLVFRNLMIWSIMILDSSIVVIDIIWR